MVSWASAGRSMSLEVFRDDKDKAMLGVSLPNDILRISDGDRVES